MSQFDPECMDDRTAKLTLPQVNLEVVKEMVRNGLSPIYARKLYETGFFPLVSADQITDVTVGRIADALSVMTEYGDTMPKNVKDFYLTYIRSGAPVRIMNYYGLVEVDRLISTITGFKAFSVELSNGHTSDIHISVLRAAAIMPDEVDVVMKKLKSVDSPEQLLSILGPILAG